MYFMTDTNSKHLSKEWVKYPQSPMSYSNMGKRLGTIYSGWKYFLLEKLRAKFVGNTTAKINLRNICSQSQPRGTQDRCVSLYH